MVSKTRMLELVEGLRAKEIAAALDAHPKLLGVRDKKGRNWLHVCCGLQPKSGKRGEGEKRREGKKLAPAARIETARVLLAAGLDLDGEAFREGDWKATPLWYAIARGKCLPLAKFLLERGANPNHCLWAAAFSDNVAAIELLVAHGAEIDPVQEGHTPFLGAVQWSRFRGAQAMLDAGANVDFQDAAGMTALHYMLKKGSDVKQVRMLIERGARCDLPNAEGATAAEIIGRRRDAAFRKLARRLAAC